MKKLTPYVLILLCVFAPASWAEGFEWKDIYVGGGLGTAEVPPPGESASALQLFLGYPLPGALSLDPELYRVTLEAGYVDVSDARRDSYWVTPTVRRYLNSELDLVARLGVEAGHDTGLIGALGLAYKINRAFAVRLEYVERSHTPVLMINLVNRDTSFNRVNRP